MMQDDEENYAETNHTIERKSCLQHDATKRQTQQNKLGLGRLLFAFDFRPFEDLFGSSGMHGVEFDGGD